MPQENEILQPSLLSSISTSRLYTYTYTALALFRLNLSLFTTLYACACPGSRPYCPLPVRWLTVSTSWTGAQHRYSYLERSCVAVSGNTMQAGSGPNVTGFGGKSPRSCGAWPNSVDKHRTIRCEDHTTSAAQHCQNCPYNGNLRVWVLYCQTLALLSWHF